MANRIVRLGSYSLLMTEKEWLRALTCVVKDSVTECWNWTGYRWARNQRPVIRAGGRQTTGSLVAYAWNKGDIPIGLEVCHKCDNANCINPDHLWLGTHKDNMQDMWNKGRGYDGSAKLAEQTTEQRKISAYKAWETRRKNQSACY